MTGLVGTITLLVALILLWTFAAMGQRACGFRFTDKHRQRRVTLEDHNRRYDG